MTTAPVITPGILYIVATPIGHREDISARAISTLQSVDCILAEDTRHSLQLLTALGIKKPMISLHAHNESNKSASIITMLQEGRSCALISDAGTPLISDPGFPLVQLAREHHLSVVPIPGACALITALSAAGVASDIFTFCGFLPAKQAARQDKLKSLQTIEHTLIFYESTHRILESIQDIAHIFGESCSLVMAKELTKTFERFVAGSCADVQHWLLEDPHRLKGEFVLILPPRVKEKKTEDHLALLSILMTELPLKQAVKLACQLTHTPKNDLYKIALNLQKNGL
jgi:16S rRNA (cytidine1402-2'-O)-methyltransferase